MVEPVFNSKSVYITYYRTYILQSLILTTSGVLLHTLHITINNLNNLRCTTPNSQKQPNKTKHTALEILTNT